MTRYLVTIVATKGPFSRTVIHSNESLRQALEDAVTELKALEEDLHLAEEAEKIIEESDDL